MLHVELLDFRVPEAQVEEDEIRRMKREKIPTGEEVKTHQIGRFWATAKLGLRQCNRLKALLPFFTNERMESIVIPIISVNSRISLRALDWFVINYSKKHKIALVGEKAHVFNVYNDYRAWLRYWRRDLFDAFRRGPRVYFEHGHYKYSTTPAQLNFLYWCEKTGGLSYCDRHLQEIESDMNHRITECRKEKSRLKKEGSKRKRCELSKAPSVKCMVYSIPVTMKFTK
jgi:hypothetical protein